jgi:uncharacterized protein YceK
MRILYIFWIALAICVALAVTGCAGIPAQTEGKPVKAPSNVCQPASSDAGWWGNATNLLDRFLNRF